MKKTVKTLALLFVSSLVMMSCGGVESDIEEACDLYCAREEAQDKAAWDNDNKEAVDALDEKYGDNGSASKEDKEAYEKGTKDCECGDAK